jgi:hypothetical protein
MMEVASTSEMTVNFYQTKRRYNPEDSHLRNHEASLELRRVAYGPMDESHLNGYGLLNVWLI